MKIKNLTKLKFGEKPLDNIVLDGGYTSIFNVMACVGDSLSSGEFEYVNSKGEKSYHDMYEYSWGQYIGRKAGIKVYNFSRGGMTAKEYIESFAVDNGMFDKEKKAKAYVIALGVNDIINYNHEIGDTSDIDCKDYKNNKQTFTGYYSQIIQRYKEIAPSAKFFLVTMPRANDENDVKRKAFAKLINDIANIFSNCYVIDLYKYAPIYDEKFKSKFFLNGHMNPMGYKFTADIISSYIDYIVKKNFEDFKSVGFINYSLDR